MSNGFTGRAIKCPFYTFDEKGRIHCECGTLEFPDQRALREYVFAYCAALPEWETCTLAKERLKYYDRRD